jgi:DNA (cytosine-5)-methyltransferase 1
VSGDAAASDASTGLVIDCFAGPGGWDEGVLPLGIRPVGIEWDEAACLTARAAGHARIRADVSVLPTEPMVGKVTGLIQSPPCQAWSMAGKRKGELDRLNCHTLADRMAAGDDSTDWTSWEDERSPLVCQPVRWVRDLRPEWVVLEEVPAVAPLWEHFALIFRRWGYSVWTGDLNAADYGVPQTRTRRILIASRVRSVTMPAPTHAQNPATDLFGGELLPWVTMAEALGWGMTRRPSVTVMAGSGRQGGADPLDGGSGSRQTLRNARESGDWAFVSAGVTGQGRPKDPESQPADTLTGKGTAYWVQRERSGDRAEEGFLASEEPAQCLTSKARSWTVWPYERPATTVVGSYCPDVISPPGYRTTVSRQNAEGGVRVTVAEGGVLQSFRPDYPWQGSRTKQYQQIGNAIPPRLALHVAAEAMGVQVPDAIEAGAAA